MYRGRWLYVLGCIGLAGCSSAEDLVVSDSNELMNALADPEQDTIEIAVGAFEGTFEVNRAVTLKGDSDGGTILRSSAGAVLLIGETAGTVVLQNITIESSHTGLLAQEAEGLELLDITFSTETGVGAYIHDAQSVRLERVNFAGGLSEAALGLSSDSFAASDFPVVGLYLDGVSSADLRSVNVSGYAGLASVFHGSQVSWSGGSVQENAGTNILVESGTVNLNGVRVASSKQSELENAVEPVGIVVADSGTLNSTDLVVSSIGGHGLLQDHSQSTHSQSNHSQSNHSQPTHCQQTRLIKGTKISVIRFCG